MIEYRIPKHDGPSMAFRDRAWFRGGFRILAINQSNEHYPVIEAVDARYYMSSTGHTVYAAIWIRKPDRYMVSGAGMARGYGYDKRSAALWEAFTRTGIVFMPDDPEVSAASFAARGDSKTINCLTALVREMYPDRLIYVVRSHE